MIQPILNRRYVRCCVCDQHEFRIDHIGLGQKVRWSCDYCGNEHCHRRLQLPGWQRVSALLAQVRLEEASYWAEQLGAEWTRVDGSSSAKRLAELERAAGAGK